MLEKLCSRWDTDVVGEVEMAADASEISQFKLSEKVKEDRFNKKSFPLEVGKQYSFSPPVKDQIQLAGKAALCDTS